MDVIRIAELLEPFLDPGRKAPKAHASKADDRPPSARQSAVLSPAQLRCISIYIDLLLHWNSRINLTSIRQPEEIVTRHFGESLFAAHHLFPAPTVHANSAEPDSAERSSSKPRVIDVGSGAGFPGLPIKLWAPAIHLTLIESSQKKTTFLREVVRALALTDVDVFSGRSEAFPGPPASADIVTLRAVERFDTILPSVTGLVAPGGRMAVLLGESQIIRVRRLAPTFRWEGPARLPLSASRAMIIGRKESR